MANQLEIPWEPSEPLQVSPSEYERQVIDWLKSVGGNLSGLAIRHQEKLSGQSGEYSLDGVADFVIFQGAQIRVLIECKRYNRPVERDVILTTHAKLHELGANKAMIFSTSGFQRGAIEYASLHGIATVVFSEGSINYFTKSYEPTRASNLPSNLPKFSGIMVTIDGKAMCVSFLSIDNLVPLTNWLKTSNS